MNESLVEFEKSCSAFRESLKNRNLHSEPFVKLFAPKRDIVDAPPEPESSIEIGLVQTIDNPDF